MMAKHEIGTSYRTCCSPHPTHLHARSEPARLAYSHVFFAGTCPNREHMTISLIPHDDNDYVHLTCPHVQ